jgi:predicted RNase H-like HicB family nuclease
MFPGLNCISEGGTREETLADIKEAIGPYPEPVDVDLTLVQR